MGQILCGPVKQKGRESSGCVWCSGQEHIRTDAGGLGKKDENTVAVINKFFFRKERSKSNIERVEGGAPKLKTPCADII